MYVQEEKTFEQISQNTKVSTAQLLRWAKADDWKTKKAQYRQRIAAAKEETRALMREEILLQDLVNQKNLLDKYLEGRDYDKSDFNTYSLYRDILNGIAKLLADMRKRDESLRGIQKTERPQAFLDFLKDLTSFLKEHDPEALLVLEKIFDPFVDWAKEKYA